MLRASTLVASLAWLALLPFLGPAPARAQASAQFAIADFQAPEASSVDGFRFSILLGELDSMRGLDLGLVSLSKAARLEGVAFVFGGSWVTGSSEGAAISMINIHEGNAKGFLGAMVNIVGSMDEGVNFGVINFTRGKSMVDLSGFGMSERSEVQVGVVNVTKHIETVQIGLINVAENGFFPVFPFFNVPKK